MVAYTGKGAGMKRILCLAGLMLGATGVFGGPVVVDRIPESTVTALETETASEAQWSVGADFRLRYVASNNMPTASHGEGGHSEYARFRTRLWGKVTTDRFEAFVRLGNEFRYYRSPDKDEGKQRFPDVTFLDNLYVTFKEVGGWADVKVGRQEMVFGSKRIISDGTGGDGSRTNYFDALRITFDCGNKRSLDAFALYMAREDWLPTLGETHDAKSKRKKGYDYDTTGYNQNEYGAGLYYQDRSSAALGWDLYYVFKVEEGRHSTVNPNNGPFHTHTFGTRFLPKFTQTLSGEVELSVQAGDDALLAFQAYAGVTYAPAWQMKPKFTLAVHYLSGDRDGARGEHAWHPVFNRETGVGDLVAAMFSKNAYTNFLYPHLKVELTPAENQKVALQTGPMFAPVEENDASGGTYGTFRGYFAQAKYTVAVGKIFAQESVFERMSLSFLGEVLTKGSYFERDQDDTAVFGQVELTCAF